MTEVAGQEPTICGRGHHAPVGSKFCPECGSPVDSPAANGLAGGARRRLVMVGGVVGVVETVRGADRLPDRATYGLETPREPVYSVAFASRELWGPSDEGVWTVALDLWESYLEAP